MPESQVLGKWLVWSLLCEVAALVLGIRRCGTGNPGKIRHCVLAINCGSRGLQNAVVLETLDRGRMSRIVSIWAAPGEGRWIIKT